MNNTATKTNSKFTIQQIAMIAVMTAVTCVLAPLSVPIGAVPISTYQPCDLFFPVHSRN
ncbi:MAG: hypothetical protein ACLUD0_04700 [Eubacterium ramulus]